MTLDPGDGGDPNFRSVTLTHPAREGAVYVYSTTTALGEPPDQSLLPPASVREPPKRGLEHSA